MGLAHGTIGWTDVASPDTARAESFYKKIFGWDAEATAEEGMPYTMFSKDGKTVAGMGPLSAEQQAAGQPSAWSSYVIVDDLDATFARAQALGATVLVEPMQIMDAGSMFFIIDPVGAVIGFWQSGTHDGAEVFNVPDTMTWNDLGCRDVGAAVAFYTELLGWSTSEMDMGEGNMYTMFSVGDRPTGGTWDISGAMPDEVPAHWLTWFNVSDVDATASKVSELGGRIIQPSQDSPMGKMAIVADPAGATFGIIASTQPDGQPPR
jgi:predicted enzyme related to lactoylglutathione lyase